jgi:hypothetical protein
MWIFILHKHVCSSISQSDVRFTVLKNVSSERHVVQCKPTDISEEHITILRVKQSRVGQVINKHHTGSKQSPLHSFIHSSFFFDLLFSFEDGGDLFL